VVVVVELSDGAEVVLVVELSPGADVVAVLPELDPG
jgi:hypothetical protein